MDLSEETVNVLYKNTIRYLYDIVNKVPNTVNILKSYYASKFRISQLQTKITLEKNKNKSEARCPHCCLRLRETQSRYVVRPEVRNSKFAQKLSKKVDSSKKLTRFQTKYLKKNSLKTGNQLVTICGFCKKEVVRNCAKPVKQRVDANAIKSIPKQKKRSKKKKDQFCGLEKEVVSSVQAQINGKERKQYSNGMKTNSIGAKINQKNPKVNNNVNGFKTKNNGKNLSSKNTENIKNKIVNNQISKRKEFIKQKKNTKKLNNILNLNSTKAPKNCLAVFLQSLGK
jgi:hypothetical protein